jgi:Lrp/AsnC family transcriptional regulator, regulator for asnA, asnC and gidA
LTTLKFIDILFLKLLISDRTNKEDKSIFMDETDSALMEILQKDAHFSSDELAKQLHVSSATVRRRTRKLIRDGVIRIVALTDPKKVGLSTIVGIMLEFNLKNLDKSADDLTQYKQVKSVALTTGRFNCTVLAFFSSTDEFQEFMRTVVSNLEGLTSVETHIFLEYKKGRFLHGD